MLARVNSASVQGIEGCLIEVEVDISNGLPQFDIVGLPDAAVREARERVRAAIKNSGYEFPLRRVTVNLAPADVRKEGPGFDLPIAVGILIASGQVPPARQKGQVLGDVLVGELSLDGSVRPVNGILAMAMAARAAQHKGIILPVDSAPQAACLEGLEVLPARSLAEVCAWLRGDAARTLTPHNSHQGADRNPDNRSPAGPREGLDYADVRGQDEAKRALEIAAAGGHNVLLVGPPGSGKTMLARRLPTILPPLSYEESLEVTRLYSIAGLLPAGMSLVSTRPFRAPHHSASGAALAGGGRLPRPGEVSLAHCGVLFLDELPEFHRDALEVLRQPLEDGVVTVSRGGTSHTYPAGFMLVAAMNPCPCGGLGDPGRQCRCSSVQVERYRRRISAPFLDRIDIQVEVPRVTIGEIETAGAGEPSAAIRERVGRARDVQRQRLAGTAAFTNSRLTATQVRRYCRPDREGRDLLRMAFHRLGLSMRAYERVLKVGRTIADLEGAEEIATSHLAEAIRYRCLDRSANI